MYHCKKDASFICPPSFLVTKFLFQETMLRIAYLKQDELGTLNRNDHKINKFCQITYNAHQDKH